jgi:hypothetical protein
VRDERWSGDAESATGWRVAGECAQLGQGAAGVRAGDQGEQFGEGVGGGEVEQIRRMSRPS